MKRPADREERFLDLIRRNRSRIDRISRSWTRTPEELQDLRSEIFLQLWRSMSSFDGRSREDSWLYRVALNTALLHARGRQRRRVPEESLDETTGPATLPEAPSRLEDRERFHLLHGALRRLGEIDRTLVTLWLEELTYRQIADITGLSENHVGVALHRARRKLAQLIAKEESSHGPR